MNKLVYLSELDRALLFAARHTDEAGRMVVTGEIDTKDSGWLVLGGVIRMLEAGKKLEQYDLETLCRNWALASIRVDDTKSAWTTFALLYAHDLTGGRMLDSYSALEREEFRKFICQIDMRFLLEASRNYRVCAAMIDVLRLRYHFVEKPSVDVRGCIRWMLDGYLGNSFFNDDDGRGDRRDRRIDAYSAEIIGLLLHYDEIYGWNSPEHDKIMEILKDFCDDAIYLIDRDGEFAKWGRSLRGEAEVKKIFLWEYAQKNGISGYGNAAAAKLFSFFKKTGINQDGKVGRDKAFDRGIYDAYTTHVQAQGYGIYGLAMAMRFASGTFPEQKIPSEVADYQKFLSGPGILCCNHASTGVHFILPAGNRLTKNMFYWHNRITGENDVEVDVSAKFLPLPYFGHLIPAPYDGPSVPLIPMIDLSDGKMLVPRNLNPDYKFEDGRLFQHWEFCRPAEYQPFCDLKMESVLTLLPDGLQYDFHFSGSWPEGAKCRIYFPDPTDDKLLITKDFRGNQVQFESCRMEISIYAPDTPAQVAVLAATDTISYTMRWSK